MKKYPFLSLILICFIATSCDEKEPMPPYVNGVWTALSTYTYFVDDVGSYNETYTNYWEGEKVLILNTDNTWEEQTGEIIHTGYWELRYENKHWVLYMQQTVSYRKFFVVEASYSTLILNEIVDFGTSQRHSKTTYAKMGRN